MYQGEGAGMEKGADNCISGGGLLVGPPCGVIVVIAVPGCAQGGHVWTHDGNLAHFMLLAQNFPWSYSCDSQKRSQITEKYQGGGHSTDAGVRAGTT